MFEKRRPRVPLPLVLLAMIFCAALAASPASSPDRIVWGSVAPVVEAQALKPVGPSASDDDAPIGQFVANFHPHKPAKPFQLPAPDDGNCQAEACGDCGRRRYFDGQGWYLGKIASTFAQNWRSSGIWYPGKIWRRWRGRC
jgi:hypothetical protein